MRPLLVGEQNTLSDDPRFALYPRPRGRADDRLRRVLGLTDFEYLCAFNRVNLLPKGARWKAGAARNRAETLSVLYGGSVVLLGARVANAFDLDYRPFTRVGRFYMIPHPSGRCRLWNEPGSARRARLLVERAMSAW